MLSQKESGTTMNKGFPIEKNWINVKEKPKYSCRLCLEPKYKRKKGRENKFKKRGERIEKDDFVCVCVFRSLRKF